MTPAPPRRPTGLPAAALPRPTLRPGARLVACRLQLATLQDRLAHASLPAAARAELEGRIAALAARIGALVALRERLLRVVLG